jgi:hypothetical protein
MKTIGILILLLFSILSFECSNHNQNAQKTVSANDTVIEIQGDYIVKIHSNDGEVGSSIVIENKITHKKSTFDSGPIYLSKIVGDKAIFDAGTGVERGLSVYDLKTDKDIFSSSYIDGMDVKNGKIYFKHLFMDDKPSIQPDTTGLAQKNNSGLDVYLVEDWIYDLDKNEVTKAGNVRYQ